MLQLENVGDGLENLVERNLDASSRTWIQEKLKIIVENRATKDLYLTYSLLAGKVPTRELKETATDKSDVARYIGLQGGNALQIARIYLLRKALESDSDFFRPKVAQLAQVADTGELEAFLKFLVLLPDPEDYHAVAVDTLRTNIVTLFDAISQHNPYPALYFNDQQWNQMYLKAAFMQRDLLGIVDVASRANPDLARIISDYAHERWAASRTIDPHFWRPVAPFLEGGLLDDMERLLQSADESENKAATLCCVASDKAGARSLLEKYPKWATAVRNNEITWFTI